MNREELAAYLTDTYSSEGEHLFAKYPGFLVFRHNGNRKWFAVIMDIPRKNLGLSGEGKFGPITKRCVIYRGSSVELDNGVAYVNVEDYLKAL